MRMVLMRRYKVQYMYNTDLNFATTDVLLM